jgi:hypothetical protein
VMDSAVASLFVAVLPIKARGRMRRCAEPGEGPIRKALAASPRLYSQAVAITVHDSF